MATVAGSAAFLVETQNSLSFCHERICLQRPFASLRPSGHCRSSVIVAFVVINKVEG
jgi:hypothetical protein